MVEIIKIDEDTYRREDDFVRFFLLKGRDFSVMIDSGANCPHAYDLVKMLVTNEIVLINTHGDGDHISGTGSFKEILMHKNDYVNCAIQQKFPQIKLKELSDGEVVDMGNRKIKVIYIPGHTKGSLAFLDIEKRILYAGDSVQNTMIYMFGERRCPELFEKALNKLIDMKDEYDYIYSSHGDFRLEKEYINKVKDSWLKVLNNELDYKECILHGTKVKAYKSEHCGFYLAF